MNRKHKTDNSKPNANCMAEGSPASLEELQAIIELEVKEMRTKQGGRLKTSHCFPLCMYKASDN